MTPGSLRRVADAEAVARAAADLVVDAAVRSVAERGRFTLALAGGSTPRRLYALLADASGPFRDRVGWDRTHVFFGDERHVPPDHPDSNYRMAREALLDRVPVDGVHRMHGEEPDAATAAARYEGDVGLFFGLPAGAPPPRLDLVLLGLGRDGHTASLEERRRWVVAPFVEALHAHRPWLTLPVLCRAREALFLVSGEEKADALARVFAPRTGDASPPAARLRLEAGAPIWIADLGAASRVPGEWGGAT